MANFQKADATTDKPYFSMLSEKITNGEKVKFVDGKEQVIKKTDKVEKFLKEVSTGNQTKILSSIYPQSKWAPIFNGYPWNKIDKAPFSGKGGSGAGAEITALTECMQCYVCSYQFNIKKKKLVAEDITKKNLQAASKFVKADRTLEQCLKNGPKDWMDGGVYTATSNKIFNEYRTKMSGAVYFHRGSKFMNDLYKAMNVCRKNDRNSGSPKAPGSFGNDKWNPGDIWASTLSVNSQPLNDYTEDWGKLNERVAELSGILGGRTELLAISLKKATSPTITKYKDPQAKPKPPVKYVGYTYGKNGDFFSSQDIYIMSNSADMQCRTFNGAKSWQGEIKGKMAAGGKIGGGNINFYSERTLSRSVFGNGGSEQTLITKIHLTEDRFMKHFYSLYVEGNEKQINPNEVVSYEEFVEKVKNHRQKANFWNSKYICLQLVKAINDSTSAQRNDFMTSIFRYASSDTDQSSFYIKLH